MRRHWQWAGGGTVSPLDAVVGWAGATVTLGVRELMCQVNAGSCGLRRAAALLARAAQLDVSAEMLRQWVEAEGRAVQRAQQRQMLPASWSAQDCRVGDVGVASSSDGAAASGGKTRVYLGADGVIASPHGIRRLG